ncbi:hypothetical protein CsSME_00008075 [Camellia sinensis var. sinensis]
MNSGLLLVIQWPMFKVKQNYVVLGCMLEKEMIDLTVQRDLVGFNNYPHLQVRKSPECENPVPDTSPLASPHSLDIGVRSVNRYLYSYGHSGRSSDDHYIQILLEFEENFVPNDTSPQLLVGASIVFKKLKTNMMNGTLEDLCREVRCIEA